MNRHIQKGSPLTLVVLLVMAVGCVKTEPSSERPRRTEFTVEGNVSGRVIDAPGTVVAAPDVTRDEGDRIVLTCFYGERHQRHRFIAPIDERGAEDNYVAQVDVVASGEVRLYIETERKGGVGHAGGWIGPDTVARTTFVQQVPAGAHLEIAVRTGHAPADLRLRIDECGDGIIDVEVPPDQVESGDELDHLPIFSNGSASSTMPWGRAN